MSWIAAEAAGMRFGVAAYLVAAAMSLPGLREWRHAGPMRVLGVGAGIVALGISLALRWLDAGQGPFLTLYEVLVSNLFSIGLVFGIGAWRNSTVRAGAWPVLAVLSALGIWATGLPREVVPLPPTFGSPWLWVHVLSGKLFLGLALVAAAAGAREAMHGTDAAREGVLWRFAGLALACDSAMLLAGALWARSAWGHYWNWDPVETWALITWFALAALLHARSALRLPPRVAGALMVAVWLLALITFLGIPFLSHAPHKGVF